MPDRVGMNAHPTVHIGLDKNCPRQLRNVGWALVPTRYTIRAIETHQTDATAYATSSFCFTIGSRVPVHSLISE
jgi:hypothetical protein